MLMSAIMSVTSFTCFVLMGLATLYLEATSIPERMYLYLFSYNVCTGYVQQVKLMHLIGNRHFVIRSVNTLWMW